MEIKLMLLNCVDKNELDQIHLPSNSREKFLYKRPSISSLCQMHRFLYWSGRVFNLESILWAQLRFKHAIDFNDFDDSGSYRWLDTIFRTEGKHKCIEVRYRIHWRNRSNNIFKDNYKVGFKCIVDIVGKITLMKPYFVKIAVKN